MDKNEVKKEIKIYLDSQTMQDKIAKIVKDRIKNEKMLEDKVVEITTNVLTQLYKNLWIKRNFWKTGLTNKSN
jgi:hypothetical protein